LIQPEFENLEHFLLEFLIAPVYFWLLLGKLPHVTFVSLFIIPPSRLSCETWKPVIRWCFSLTPQIPIVFWICPRLTGLFKPLMLIWCVIQHQVNNNFDI
jgi:hypothetical protein